MPCGRSIIRGAVTMEPFLVPGGEVGRDVSLYRDLLGSADRDELVTRSCSVTFDDGVVMDVRVHVEPVVDRHALTDSHPEIYGDAHAHQRSRAHTHTAC